MGFHGVDTDTRGPPDPEVKLSGYIKLQPVGMAIEVDGN